MNLENVHKAVAAIMFVNTMLHLNVIEFLVADDIKFRMKRQWEQQRLKSLT